MWVRHRKWADDGTWDRVLAALLARADKAGQIDWAVPVDTTINRAHQHAIDRARGGLTTKVHHAVDGKGRPLAVVLTPGQAHDGQTLQVLLGDLRVARTGPGRPRSRPEALLADKAYSSRAIRQVLRSRGIKALIPERRDQQDHRCRRGRTGERVPSFDREVYKGRSVVERSFALLKQWRGLATRFDKLAIVYRSAVALAAVLVWTRNQQTRPRDWIQGLPTRIKGGPRCLWWAGFRPGGKRPSGQRRVCSIPRRLRLRRAFSEGGSASRAWRKRAVA